MRRALFPIDADELAKFLLVGSIKFFVVMALTLTRDGKDAMVVAECGAEAIAFLKVRTQGGGREAGRGRFIFVLFLLLLICGGVRDGVTF